MGWIGQSYMAGEVTGKLFLTNYFPSALEITGVMSRQKYYETTSCFTRIIHRRSYHARKGSGV